MKPFVVWSTVHIEKHSGRDILSGIFSYIESGHPWRFRLIQRADKFTAEDVETAKKDGVDGFLLTFFEGEATLSALSRSTVPIVMTNPVIPCLMRRKAPTVFVMNDNEAIGAMGANYLSKLGRFSCFGFVHSQACNGHQKTGYSEERLHGFSKTLQENGFPPPRVFAFSGKKKSQDDARELSDWLSKSPKPMAVMVASDWRAMDVIAAANHAGLEIPRQIAVLGVDNDELLVTHSTPPLSSIHPGHTVMGFRSAAELERLMSSKRQTSGRLDSIPPLGVVERESTRPMPPGVSLVERAKNFIRKNMAFGITTTDVITHLGCSRNLADRRYKEIEGMTIRAAIEKSKMDEVKRLLKSSRRSMTTIAKQCGFKSTSHLSHLFRQRFGVSMGEWRNLLPPTSNLKKDKK